MSEQVVQANRPDLHVFGVRSLLLGQASFGPSAPLEIWPDAQQDVPTLLLQRHCQHDQEASFRVGHIHRKTTASVSCGALNEHCPGNGFAGIHQHVTPLIFL